MNLYSQLLDLGVDESFIAAVSFADAVAAPIADKQTTSPAPNVTITTPKTPASPKPAVANVPKPVVATAPKPVAPVVAKPIAAKPMVAKPQSVRPVKTVKPKLTADQKIQAQYDKAMAKYNARIKALNPNAGRNPWADQIIKEQQQDNFIPPPDPRKSPRSFAEMIARVRSPQVANLLAAWQPAASSGQYGQAGKIAVQYNRAMAISLGLNQRKNINNGFDMPNGLNGVQQAQLVNSIRLPNTQQVSANPMPGVGLSIYGYTPPKGLKTYTSSISDFTISKDKWFNQQTGQVEPIPANLRSGSWKGSEGGSALPKGYKEDSNGNRIA